MLEIGRGLDLGEEPLGADDRGELGPEHLDGDPAVVLEVLRQVHGGHAARAELPLDPVAVGEGFGQAGERVRHGNSSMLAPESRLKPRLGWCR